MISNFVPATLNHLGQFWIFLGPITFKEKCGLDIILF